MARPAEDSADPTTIQVSRAQRISISDIQAELVLDRGRHVTTKETLSAIINYWKDGHRGDTPQGTISAEMGSELSSPVVAARRSGHDRRAGD